VVVVAARLLLRRWCVVGVLHRPVVLHGRVTYVSSNKIYLMGLRLDSATCSKSNINISGIEPTNRYGISRFDRVCDTYHFEFGLHVTVCG